MCRHSEFCFHATPSNGKWNGINSERKPATAAEAATRQTNQFITKPIAFYSRFPSIGIWFSSLIFFLGAVDVFIGCCGFVFGKVYRSDWTMIKSSYSNSLTLSPSLSVIHSFIFIFIPSQFIFHLIPLMVCVCVNEIVLLCSILVGSSRLHHIVSNVLDKDTAY